MMMSKIFKKIGEAVEDGDHDEVIELIQEALEDEESPQDILNKGLLEGMNKVGEQFKEGTVFVPEVLMSAKAVDIGMEILKPLLNAGDIRNAGKIVFCTVEGDLHDIGKKLCVMLLQGAGYEVVDLGTDVPVVKMIEAVKENKPHILAMSAMLTTTMLAMDEAASALKKEGLDQVSVMIGGAPLSTDYALKIGAHYSEDAIGAVELANQLRSN
jgi:5-methyltetrahydrofolate--homocysteine methyltransferase